MSATTVSIRVDLAEVAGLELKPYSKPCLRVQRVYTVDEHAEYAATAVLLEAESLEDLRDWLADAAEDVRREIVKKIRTRYDEPDTDAAAADTGALA